MPLWLGARFYKAELSQARVLPGAHGERTDFSEANLVASDLSNGNLAQAILRGANLMNASLRRQHAARRRLVGRYAIWI